LCGCWVKAQAGIQGNELTDTLAKEAATNVIAICCNKIPKSVVNPKIGRSSVEKWQSAWNRTTKSNTTKECFPMVAERLNRIISTNQYFTTMMTSRTQNHTYTVSN
jgi:hypothetical protein